MQTDTAPMVSPKLVGRTAELERLLQLLRTVRGGTGQCVLITGEAGIGKSRLLAEFSRLAPEPCQTFSVHCYEQDRAFPYAPLVDALRLYLAQHPSDTTITTLGPFAAEIARLLPELSPAFPALQATPALEPDVEKRRLFEALARFLTGLAQTQPLLLIIEDVQWSDEASLSFLDFFTRRLVVFPVFVILTYRPGEASIALQQLLAQLNRKRMAHELALRALMRSEVDVMLRTIFAQQHSVHPEFLDVICDLSEGNPFFIEEMLKALVVAGDIVYANGTWTSQPVHDLHIPRSVRDAVQGRVAQLHDAARQVLILAAVAGRRFGFTLLQAATGISEPTLVQVLKELVNAQLVVEQAADEFGFRHALIREAVYTSLLRRERIARHRAMAETLERLPASTTVTRPVDLAYHFYEAEVWDRAFLYSEQAGQQAQDLHAPREAIQHCTHALEAAHHLPQAAPLTTLHYRRGNAHDILGLFEHAHADYDAALSAARLAADTRGEWHALVALGLLWAAQDYRQAGDYLERALGVARESSDATLMAHSLNRIGNWHANVEQPSTALTYHHEALEIFQRLDDPRGLVETLDLLGMMSQLNSRLEQAYAFFQRAISLAYHINDQQAASSCLACLTLCAASYLKNTDAPATGLAEAAAAALEAIKLAGELGWRAGESFAHLMYAMSLGPQGEYRHALIAAQAGLTIAEEIEHRQWITAAHTTLGMVYLDMLAFETAQAHLEQALTLAREVGSGVWIGSAASFLAITYLGQGDALRAQALLDEVLTGDAPMQTQVQRLCWAARGEIALALGDAETALKIVEQLIAAVDTPGDIVIPRLWKLRAQALIRRGSQGEAEATLLAARNAAHAQAASPWLWRIHIDLGKLYQTAGRRTEAAAAYTAARDIVQRIGDSIDDPRLQQTFSRRAAAMMPRPAVPSPVRAEQQKPGGLTAREREIAVLIAQGNSNRAIADQLIVGVRTVEAHITRVLAKLDFTSRTQIATWAVEQGMLR